MLKKKKAEQVRIEGVDIGHPIPDAEQVQMPIKSRNRVSPDVDLMKCPEVISR